MGHVRDLPKSQVGVDIEKGFEPKYITVRGQGKTLQELRKAVKTAERVYLATDPDREGEAIAWHLVEALNLDRPRAPTGSSSTRSPRTRSNRRSSSPGRSTSSRSTPSRRGAILDRLVGYKLSPLLWSKVQDGALSAGRVQSVALRLIVDREREIDAFVPEEYWTIEAELAPAGSGGLDGATSSRPSCTGRRREGRAAQRGRGARAIVERARRRSAYRSPKCSGRAAAQPGAAVHHQHAAAGGLPAARVHRPADDGVAQQLYEGLDIGDEGTVGLITYMRTDSTNVSPKRRRPRRASYIAERLRRRTYRPAEAAPYKSRARAPRRPTRRSGRRRSSASPKTSSRISPATSSGSTS